MQNRQQQVKISYDVFPPVVPCRILCTNNPNQDNTTIDEKIYMKYDTRADITVLPAASLGINTSESDFSYWVQTHENLEFMIHGHIAKNRIIVAKSKGIDKQAEHIKSYAYQVDQFIINPSSGSLNMGSIPIFICFDPRFKTPLLGRDVLSLLNTVIDNDKNIITLSLTDKYNAHYKSNGKITPQFFLDNGIYNKDTFLLHDIQQ